MRKSCICRREGLRRLLFTAETGNVHSLFSLKLNSRCVCEAPANKMSALLAAEFRDRRANGQSENGHRMHGSVGGATVGDERNKMGGGVSFLTISQCRCEGFAASCLFSNGEYGDRKPPSFGIRRWHRGGLAHAPLFDPPVP